MLAAGSRVNTVTSDDLMPRASVGTSQLNVDGQQVTSTISATGFGQPHYARDSIAEFEFVSNRFDATQGRSAGVQVNAVTKSGTNTFAGSAAGYFRHDRMNASDFIVESRAPLLESAGQPDLRRTDREGQDPFLWQLRVRAGAVDADLHDPYPSFNQDLTGNRTDPKASARVDIQFNVADPPHGTRQHVAVVQPVRSALHWRRRPDAVLVRVDGTSQQPVVRVADENSRHAGRQRAQGGLQRLRVRGDSERAVREQPGNASFPSEATSGAARPSFSSAAFASGRRTPMRRRTMARFRYSLRDDYTTWFNGGGHHTTKIGGEWLHQWGPYFQCTNCMGTIDAGSNGCRRPISSRCSRTSWTSRPGTWRRFAVS